MTDAITIAEMGVYCACNNCGQELWSPLKTHQLYSKECS